MSHKYVRHFLTSILLLASGATAIAQNSVKDNDPYTRYGLGDLRNGANVNLRGMGNAYSAYANPYSVNTENPASYASLRLTTYEAAGEGGLRTILTNRGDSLRNNQTTGYATLAYFNVGIPLGKHGGMALGLKPQTRVYYKLQDTVIDPSIGRNFAVYSGDGGLNYAFIGGAYKLGGLSVGFNFGYLFGTVRNTSVLQQIDTIRSLGSEFDRYTRMGGLYWNTGAMYEAKLNKKLMLRVGTTFTFGQNINAYSDSLAINFNSYGGLTSSDTSYKSTSVNGKIQMPVSYSFGVQLASTNNWSVNANFEAMDWSRYSNFGLKDSINDHPYRISLGGEYTPNPNSLYNYFQRVTYRVGAYYGKDYIHLQNTNLDYYAFSLGASLPFKRSNDRIHAAVEWGRRGTQTNGLIKENIFRFSLGISLNDKWFIKRKYE